MAEQSGDHQIPALAEDPNQTPTVVLPPSGSGNGRQGGDRQGRFGFAADGQQPPGGQGDREPPPLCARDRPYGCMAIWPATPFQTFESWLDPCPQPIPADLCGLWRQIGQHPPRFLMTGVPAAQQRAHQSSLLAVEGRTLARQGPTHGGYPLGQGYPA